MSQFFHGLHSRQTCQPLSMFGMLWINEYNRVLQFSQISRIFAQLLKEWDNIPQATINILINSMQRSCVALHEAVTPDIDWLSDPSLYFF
jgi:hypothetical protein